MGPFQVCLLISARGARWGGVEKSSCDAHHDVSNFLRDPWGCSVRNYTARGGVHAPHLAHRTSVISPHHRTDAHRTDAHRTDAHRTERDTLKSTYVKQLPLFGKATEVATTFVLQNQRNQ